MESTYQIDNTIEKLVRDHQAILHVVRNEFQPLSEEQKIWKPALDSWSITECLAHLNLANTYFVRQIQTKLEHAGKAAGKSANSSFSMSLNGRLMMKVVAPQATRKMPTPGIMKPRPGLESGSVFANFLEVENLFIKVVPETEKLDWQASKVASPLSTWIKFRLGDVLIFTAAHAQRHINQAKRVMGQPGFPF